MIAKRFVRINLIKINYNRGQMILFWQIFHVEEINVHLNI